jgi:Family of unknown function (DUF6159)
MAGRFGRGWSMARESFSVLRQYPRLALFPIISGAIFLLIVGAVVLSFLPQFESLYSVTGPMWDRLGASDGGQIAFYVAVAAGMYLLTAVAIFCNVALIHCALRCHVGQSPSIGDGFAAATTCLPQILGWALVSLIVGTILNAIESALRDKLGFLGRLIGGLFEVGWSVVTYFVVPVVAAERLGPIAAIRRSSAIVRSKWGESLAGGARFGLVGMLFFLQAAALFFVGLAIQLSYGAGALAGLGPLLMALGVCYGLVIMIVLMALSTIFQAGVYLYATTGQVPPTLDRDLVEGAFRPKSKVRI